MSVITRSCDTIDTFLGSLRAINCGPVNRFLADVAGQAADTQRGEYTRFARQSIILTWAKIYISDRVSRMTPYTSEEMYQSVGEELESFETFEEQMTHIARMIQAIMLSRNETWIAETLLDLHRLWARLLSGV